LVQQNHYSDGSSSRPVLHIVSHNRSFATSLHFLALIGIILHTMRGNTAYVIGLDGGGTKTTAQLADLEGTVVAETQGGPSNFQIIGIEEAARTILDLVDTCCHTVGCNNSQIGSVVAGLSGAGRTVDQQRIAGGIQDAAQKRGMYFPDLKIESDARVALEGAFLGKQGIILICGTGSIVFAKDGKGTVNRAGGWGRLIGDEGSGYEIGREAFRSVARMLDGRGKKTRLAKMLGSSFGFATHDDIVRAVYREDFDLASVAPMVLRAAQSKDRVAIGILDSAASELLETLLAVLERMGKRGQGGRTTIPLVLVGGLLESENVYSKKVKALIRRQLRNISIQKPIARPVQGAVLMAIARAGSKKTKEPATVM
jgi:N-acetylglucosamine kinase-like BadF-type ATPase